MLERLKKEQAIMRQKLLRMEEHLARKHKELHESGAKKRSLQQAEVASQEHLEIQRQELDGPRAASPTELLHCASKHCVRTLFDRALEPRRRAFSLFSNS